MIVFLSSPQQAQVYFIDLPFPAFLFGQRACGLLTTCPYAARSRSVLDRDAHVSAHPVRSQVGSQFRQDSGALCATSISRICHREILRRAICSRCKHSRVFPFNGPKGGLDVT